MVEICEAKAALKAWMTRNPYARDDLRVAAWQFRRVLLTVELTRGGVHEAWRLEAAPVWAPEIVVSATVALRSVPADMSAREVAAFLWGQLQVQLGAAWARRVQGPQKVMGSWDPTT